jgi:tRNA threonylcarbamoyladenosine biosynthesis protein TsaB
VLTLALDASTYTGTVSLLRDGRAVVERSVAMRGRDEERLMPAVADALAAAGGPSVAIDRVVCGAGPGSFTSLRIAAAIAKGVALAHGVPLFAVSSLLLIGAGAEPPLAPGLFLAVLDAMRGDRYVAELEAGADGVRQSSPVRRVALAAVAAEAARLGATLIGPAEARALSPHARGVARVADRGAMITAVDLATWEPDYGRAAEAQVAWEAAHGRPLPRA